MYRKCGQPLQSADNFCPHCGASLSLDLNAINSVGGNNYGNQIHAGGDVYYSTSNAPSTEPATYEAIPIWRSPLTQSILAWIGTLTGIASLVPFWKLVSPIITSLRSDTLRLPESTTDMLPAVAFVVLVLTAIALFSLHRVAKHELRFPIVRGWALSGNDHRIGVDRISCGSCPMCGGKMKYVNWPISWDAKGKVTKKVPALVCRRNSMHWYEVDIAEKRDQA